MFFLGRLEHEIFRKAFNVPANGQVEVAGGYLVELCQVGVEHNLVASDKVDAAFDQFDWKGDLLDSRLLFRGHASFSAPT